VKSNIFFGWDHVTGDNFDDCHDEATIVGVNFTTIKVNLWPLYA
jgi:hypothetical protein